MIVLGVPGGSTAGDDVGMDGINSDGPGVTPRAELLEGPGITGFVVGVGWPSLEGFGGPPDSVLLEVPGWEEGLDGIWLSADATTVWSTGGVSA